MLKTTIRHAAALCGTLAMLALPLAAAASDAFPQPNKPVRLIVGLPPGGPTDLQARAVAEHLRTELGTNVIVENRPGASMTIAVTEVARAPADGHTLLYSPSTPFAQSPHSFLKLPYDPLKDFTPITLASLGPLVLVAHKSVPGETLQQIVAHAKANPGQLNYGSFGIGSSSHLFGQLFAKQYGLDIVHVPYKGAGDIQKDLVAGRVQMMFASAGGAVQFVRTGNVRMVGVATPKRSSLLPNVPTLSELGAKGLDLESWVGIFGPAKMPPAVVNRLNAALVKVLANPQVKTEFEKGAYEAVSTSPKDFDAMVRRSYEEWGKLATELGVQKE